jgi:hypothetical protein
MRNLLMAAATAALLVAAAPASAQVYMGADPGGAGVQVGPFGFGVGPRYGYDTALCAFPQTLRRDDGIVRARVWARW